MKNKEQILNGYQATFALSKTSKAQIYMAMEEYAKIKLKEAYLEGFENGWERKEGGVSSFGISEELANKYVNR
jgi:hypothetical protein